MATGDGHIANDDRATESLIEVLEHFRSCSDELLAAEEAVPLSFPTE